MHGGRSPVGIASLSFKTGRYSRYLPQRMVADYEASLHDQELLSLRDGISAIDALVLDIIRTLDTGEAGSLWATVLRHKREYEAATKAGNRVGAQTAIERMFAAIEHGAADAQSRAEVANMLEKRRKLTEAEQRRLERMQRLVDMQDVLALLATLSVAVKDAVERHVDDPVAARAILTDVVAATSRVTGRRADA